MPQNDLASILSSGDAMQAMYQMRAERGLRARTSENGQVVPADIKKQIFEALHAFMVSAHMETTHAPMSQRFEPLRAEFPVSEDALTDADYNLWGEVLPHIVEQLAPQVARIGRAYWVAYRCKELRFRVTNVVDRFDCAIMNGDTRIQVWGDIVSC